MLPLTRREFLAGSARGAGLLALSSYVPSFLAQTARAATPDKDAKVLVVIQLSGGNDGLNTVIPFADDAYHRARPTIGVPAGNVLKLNDLTGLNPSMNAAAKLFAEGKMRIIQNTGYPNPDRSHFRSMEIWHTAIRETAPSEGWLGRYFDAECAGSDPHQDALAKAAIGVSLGTSPPQAFRNRLNVGLTVDNPETFRWNASGETSSLAKVQQQIFDRLNQPGAANNPGMLASLGAVSGNEPETIDFLRHTAMNAVAAGSRIRAALAKQDDHYPETGLGRQLRMTASLIRSDLPTRIYYAHLGGFDTHARQIDTHTRLLGEFSEAVSAFLADLRRQKLGDKVLVLAFSEFGRRVAENASAGTDHGAAAPMFLFGDAIRGGLEGGAPDLEKLVDGDITHAIDFRQVYTGVLEDWLGVSGSKVLGGTFQKVGVTLT